MKEAPMSLNRTMRTRTQDPVSVPKPLSREPDMVMVDTTWGELQPLHCAPGVVTVGELELIEHVRRGAALIDTRVPDSRNGVTIPGAVNLPHDQMSNRISDLDQTRINIVFCNGPQCPQSPAAIQKLLAIGYPAPSLAYYRGGLHDWVTLALPTETVD